MNVDKRFLTRKGLRLVTGLFYQDIECKKCGARWQLQGIADDQQWLCPNDCNANQHQR